MAASVRDIESKIEVESQACVEQTKDGKTWLGGFFTSRASLLPECRSKTRAKYAAELAEAQRVENDINAVVNQSLVAQLTDGGLSEQQLGILLVIALVVVILFLMLK